MGDGLGLLLVRYLPNVCRRIGGRGWLVVPFRPFCPSITQLLLVIITLPRNLDRPSRRPATGVHRKTTSTTIIIHASKMPRERCIFFSANCTHTTQTHEPRAENDFRQAPPAGGTPPAILGRFFFAFLLLLLFPAQASCRRSVCGATLVQRRRRPGWGRSAVIKSFRTGRGMSFAKNSRAS